MNKAKYCHSKTAPIHDTTAACTKAEKGMIQNLYFLNRIYLCTESSLTVYWRPAQSQKLEVSLIFMRYSTAALNTF
jgi:hypothetical protein